MESGSVIISAVLWLACAFGCAAIAKRKNRSAFGWFWLGLLLGGIGILIIGFMKSEEWGRVPCPFCTEMVLVQAKLCRHCGKELMRDITPEDLKVDPD